MEVLIGVISVLIALFAIKLQFFSEPKEELDHLEIQFRATQVLSIEVQDELEKFIRENNAWNHEIFPGVNYRTYLEELRVSHQKYLSDELINRNKSLKLTKSNILSMIQSLEKQFEALSQVRGYLRMISRQHNNS